MEHRPVPKPSHKRSKPTAKQRGAITPEVYEAAYTRSEGRCERCGWQGYGIGEFRISGVKWCLQAAHLLQRRNIEVSTTVNDIAMLCGPSVNSGTCHHWVDSTKAGRQWALDFRDELYRRSEK